MTTAHHEPTPVGISSDTLAPDDSAREIEALRARVAVLEEQVEASAAESEALFQAIGELAPDGIFIEDERGTVLRANPAACRIFGYPRDGMRGVTLQERVEPAFGRTLPEVIEEDSAASGALARASRRRDGSLFPSLVYTRFFEIDGQRRVLTFVRDATEQKAAEAALRASEERYRAIVEAIPDLVFRFSRDGTFLDVVAKDEGLLVSPVATLVGKRIADFFDPESTRQWEDRIGRALYTGEVEVCEYGLVTSDGKAHDFEARLAPASADEVQAIVRDVTERKAAERALIASEARYRSLIEHASDGIFISHRGGVFCDVNTRACQMTGYARAELLGMEIATLVEDFDPASWERVMEGEALREELTIRRGDGRLLPVEVSVQRVGEGRAQAIVRDVTQRKRHEAELVAAKEKAEEMSRLKSTFLANMSHEIRTPLTAILGFAEVLQEEVTGEALHFVELIGKGGRRLMDTLNSVLDLAQLESGSMKLRLGPVDVVERVEAITAVLGERARKRGLALTVEAPPEVWGRAEAPALDRVLTNLISNALKFTDQGGVHIVVEETEDAVVLRVTDTGIGIDAAFLPGLFAEFQQESQGLARTHEGNGLGLAITQQLVALMEGEIDVDSTKGEGTTFTVRLQRAEPPAA